MYSTPLQTITDNLQKILVNVSSPVTTDLVKFFLCNVVLIVVYCATIS